MNSLSPIAQVVPVTFEYPVHFTHGLFRPEHSLLSSLLVRSEETSSKKLLCLVEAEVARLHPKLCASISAYWKPFAEKLQLVREPWVLEGGEACKNDDSFVAELHRAVHRYGIDRHSYILVVGGGALIDMVGYAAATAHRGIRLVRVPSTVLAQCDAALSVKNSVNAFGKKNFLGTFTAPYAVLCDLDLLTTLDDRDWRSGISECIKVALLKDAPFFQQIERQHSKLSNRCLPTMSRVIERGAQLHLEHIATSGDPFEMGSSRPLDFGHWSAHKLEQISNYEIRHGEAVAIGLALDATYSHLVKKLPKPSLDRILQTLSNLGFALYVPELESDDLLRGLEEFREHLGGQLTIMLLEEIGRGIEVHEINEALMRESISSLQRSYGHAKQS